MVRLRSEQLWGGKKAKEGRSGQSLVQETLKEKQFLHGVGDTGALMFHTAVGISLDREPPMLSLDALESGGRVLRVVCSFSYKTVYPRGRHSGQTYS